ncbi:hypothetical protein AZF37_01095 [endosymbiont 'TC1' of Trimyema compressum]|uniref:ABC transporter permease n=1 Tax=endosymbiont 'TC1' of Trimyema compressum TaxID=243899 RepID=UPI0007F14D0C|nr:ABC transporter permease [endosymbiont 'TC1' of Trimyema compressum]AMP19965.1 hypothetical protein AZF37_01095 [endosymbiont 'TC1' of Trimyema compressum]
MLERFKLIFNLSRYEFKKEFLGTSLGYFWNLLKPTLTILIYWFVFGHLIKQDSADPNIPFLLQLISALVPWFFISGAMMSGSGSMLSNVNLVKKVKFSLYNIPLITLMANFFNFLIMFAIVIVISCIFGFFPNIYWLQLIYYMLATLLLLNGFNYIFATLTTLQIDFHQLLGIVLQLLMYLMPILWAMDYVLTKTNGTLLATILKINPFFYIITGFRSTILYPEFNIVNYGLNSISYVAYFWVFVIVINLIGFLLFRKYKGEFADLL